MTLPHAMLDGVLLLRARDYADSLYPGATVDTSDREYLAGTNWGELLGKALAARGLRISGDTVVEIQREEMSA